MREVAQFVMFWGLSFLSLGLAFILLNIYFGWIGRGLGLRNTKSELVIAGAASFVEGGSLWLIMTFFPLATRAMIVPLIIVALIYKITHFENYWSRFDIGMLLAFQTIIIFVTIPLIFGRFSKTELLLLLGFVILLVVIGLINDLSER